jgi:hypothetical protein
MTQQQVEVMIGKVADAQDEEYNWKQSIVDLMKLLKLDSSLSARKQLAQELGYTGALDGSAEMIVRRGVKPSAGRRSRWSIQAISAGGRRRHSAWAACLVA